MIKTVVTTGHKAINITRDEAGYFLRQGCKVVRDASGDTIKVLLKVGQHVCCDSGHQLLLAPGLVAAGVTLLSDAYGLPCKWEVEVAG